MPESFQAKWRKFRETCDPASVRILIVFAFLETLLSIYLIAGPNPWESSIIKRIAAGKSLRLEHFIVIGLWWGCLLGWIGTLIGLATSRWWGRPQTGIHPDLNPIGPKAAKWTLIFAMAAMALAVWPRMARLHHSLWNDEEYHLRTYVLGNWEPKGDGTLKLDAVTWKQAIFGNEKGNNHIWASIESRIGHRLSGNDWSDTTTFSETGLRALPFASGILTVGVLVLLGAALGSPRAGLAAGLILALHPWHVRWSVEIRGYSTMLFASTAGLFCLLRAFQTNRWRWWLGFALAQTLTLLSFAGSVYVVAAQNLVAFSLIAWSGAAGPVRLGSAARLLVAGILSFIPVALIMGPHVPQIAQYLKSSHDYAEIGRGWFIDLWSHLSTGLRPTGDAPGSTMGISAGDLIQAAPWKRWILNALLPAFLLAGLFQMTKQDWRTRLVGATLLLAGILAVVHNSLSGSAFMTWYVIYLVPLFALAVAQGALLLGKLRPNTLGSLPLIVAAGFSVVTAPALGRIMQVPRQPIRETVAAMRGISPALQEADARVLTASFGDGARQMLSYDPRLKVLKTPEELQALIQQATDGPNPLFLCFRGPASMATESPALLQAVLTDPRWLKLPSVQGMEAMLSYDLYRFAPEAIEKIELKN
ncbi:MAG: rane protein-like protein [Verrucomicrobiales bacterium]|nr:rane protein-like protein [Verrucomicrobiales bacterium]